MRGEELAWAVRASCAPHTSKDAQSRLWSDIQQLVSFSIRLAPSVISSLDDESRKRAIGAYLSIGGKAWLSEHPVQAQWMADNRVSPEECLAVYRDWHGRQMNRMEWRRVEHGDI